MASTPNFLLFMTDQQRLPVHQVLNAINDPFVPASCLPTRAEVSTQVTLWQPKQGGHVGFASGQFPGNLREMPSAVMDWMMHG